MCYASTSSRGKKNGLGNRAEKSVAVDYSGIVVMLQFSGGLAQWQRRWAYQRRTLRRARLVLGWVTVFGRANHHGMQPAT